MSEEIKEILNQLEIVARKHTIELLDGVKIETMPASIVDELRLNNYSAKNLYNYITNLQQENEELKEELKITQEKWDKDKQFSKCRTMEMLDYKSRNEKAIEYLEKHKDNTGWVELSPFTTEETSLPDLLNILQGGDEE